MLKNWHREELGLFRSLVGGVMRDLQVEGGKAPQSFVGYFFGESGGLGALARCFGLFSGFDVWRGG